MPGKRISELTALTGAGSASTDDLVIFDTDASATKRITRAELAVGMQADAQTLTNKTINLASNTLTGTTAQFNTALTDGNFATLAGSEALSNKTIDLASNTLTGTTAQFNTALADGDFATLAGSETLTNKTIDSASNTLTVNAKEATVEGTDGSRIHEFATVAALLTDTGLVAATNAIVRTRAEGFSYRVAASGAVDHNLTTAGGVKLYSLATSGVLNAAAISGVDAEVARVRIDASGNVLVGATTGSNTLTVDGTVGGTAVATQAEALAGTDNTKLMTPLRVAQAARPVFGTMKAFNWNGLSTNTFLDFEGIPSWARRVTVLVADLSTNGTSPVIIQIGDSGGIETTGYVGSGVTVGASTVSGTVYGGSGYFITNQSVATYVSHGAYQLANLAGFTWIAWGSSGLSNTAGAMFTGGSKTLSAALDRVRVTTVNGTDIIDNGIVNIMWE